MKNDTILVALRQFTKPTETHKVFPIHENSWEKLYKFIFPRWWIFFSVKRKKKQEFVSLIFKHL